MNIEKLIIRAKRRPQSDYWDRSIIFLEAIKKKSRKEMTQKQWNWLHSLKQELSNPWE